MAAGSGMKLNEAVANGGWLERHGGRLSALSNLCVVVLCLVACAVFTLRWSEKQGSSSDPQGMGALGRSIATQFPHNERTVLLAISAQCRICATEAALYRSIETKYRSRSELGFVYLMPDIAEAGQKFLSSNGLSGASYFSLDPRRLGMDVPAVAVVDRQGIVRFLAKGALGAARKTDLERMLSKSEGR
jgi:hypothetical protein